VLVRAAVIFGAVLAIAIAAYPFEWAREAAARAIIERSHAITGGSPVGMSVAGWLMFVTGPIFAVWFGHDFRRAITSARSPRPAGLSRFQGRSRARSGHRARRPLTFWLWRAPLAVPVALAVVFLVPFGFVGGAPSNWASLAGGGDFLRGVKWGLIATFVAGALVIGTELLMLTEPKRWISRTISAAALLAPIGAVVVLVTA
jgi:hypothetical protein